MSEILKTTLIGLFFGTFGTTIGGILGSVFNIKSNKMISFVLEFSSGLMMSIVSFDLIPEALKISNMDILIIGIVFGVLGMMLCDVKINSIESRKNGLLITGIVIGIGLAIHNLPEGMAIGSGFEASVKLGISVAIVILIHDIPEGIAMAVPLKNGGVNIGKVIFYTFLSGVTTGIGALIGSVIGGISNNCIGFSLAFSAGAMLFIVSGELVPQSNRLYQGKIATLGNILGFLIGIIGVNI